MGTEVLRPHDFMVDRFGAHPTSFHRRRNTPNLNTNPSQKRNFTKPDQKKKLNPPSRKSRDGVPSAADSRRKEPTAGPIAGQITILRRGESLGSLTKKINSNNHQKAKSESQIGDLAVYGGDRIGPDSPEMVPIKILPENISTPADIYAGSAFFTSPSPHSLPMPSLFFSNNKKNKKLFDDDSATRDLRRMLRLE